LSSVDWFDLPVVGVDVVGSGGARRSHRPGDGARYSANFAGTIQVFDWTANDPGMDALLAYKRNHNQARKIAGILAQRRAADPAGKLLLTSHSGGGGLAIWALEDLPPGVMVDDALLMSPALSPTYDLSRALSHVSGHLSDLFVLGTGTRVFGTIDGVKTDAAGRVGFIQPATADPQQYKKLISEPYDPSWMKYNDFGDHIGGMTRLFSRNVLAPLLLSGKLPPVSMPTTAPTPTGLGRALPTSLPATQPSAMR
jgi:hypothetical protein